MAGLEQDPERSSPTLLPGVNFIKRSTEIVDPSPQRAPRIEPVLVALNQLRREEALAGSVPLALDQAIAEFTGKLSRLRADPRSTTAHIEPRIVRCERPDLQTVVEIGVDKNSAIMFPAPLMSTIQEMGAFLSRETSAVTDLPSEPVLPAPVSNGELVST